MLTFTTTEDLYTHLDGVWGDLDEGQQWRVVRQLVHEANADGVLLRLAIVDDPATETHDWESWLDQVTAERVLAWLDGVADTITPEAD